MMRQNPKALEIYKHFKGKYYQIVTLATDTETEEEVVVYRPLYESEKVYTRPLAMFMSEVDHGKYPEVSQQYRFELVNFDTEQKNESNQVNVISGKATLCQPCTTNDNSANNVADSTEDNQLRNAETTDDTVLCQPCEERQRNNYGSGRTAEIRPKREYKEYTVMDFLDADTYEHKLEILRMLRNKLDEDMINTIAASLDLEPKGRTLDDQYEDIRYCLSTLEKYECNRLR